MKLEDEYLSDEQLEQLILQVEQHELLKAPPDFTESVLKQLEEFSQSGVKEIIPINKLESRKKEFVKYSFRVIASVAAAIVLLFSIPEMNYFQVKNVPTKQEVLATQKYTTREEVLNETSFLTKIVGNIRTWNEKLEIKFFKEENGG